MRVLSELNHVPECIKLTFLALSINVCGFPIILSTSENMIV